ncbi:AT-rich interactive domain-containing protein 1B [Anopheles marshallii]|uniref:AT-rich interactive domain-containing protein 1B n=1 Tax=Anopheles marshallii TaxID=1521116 RepID=UPI00237AF90E|nr:AT-rich interactive domain-containing protein 1B [Anopheles marshallii]
MGDAKVKQQPFFGNQIHHHHHHHQTHESPSGTTSKANGTVTMETVVMDPKHATGGLLPVSPQQQPGKDTMSGNNGTPVAGKDKSPASLKYEQLKLRKQELEKRLNEKYSQLQQIKREEAQLIGMYPSDFSCGIGPSSSSDGVNGTSGTGSGGAGTGNGAAPTLRRKIGTSFKLPENLLNNKEDDINKLLLEKQIQQQISEASLRLANDTGQPKSVRRTHKQNYEMAQQKLLAINQNLSVLKKRQQQKEQQQQQQQLKDQQAQQANDHRPTSRDDIDLHKTAQVNRFRSNSNSSSMLMHLSERRNSVKSNTSSNASGSITGHHMMQQHQHHQQMLQVQIPGGHYHLSQQPQHQQQHQSQQISPYSIHSGIIPSGSQSMTSAASAAMISQLSMLRHRARTDSFPGIATNYDSASAGSGTTEQSLKMSPLSGSGSIASGGSNMQQAASSTHGHHHLHPHHHHHHQIGPGPGRMNRLIQQQMGMNYSPPAPSGASTTTTPGYVLSPTSVGVSPGGNGTGQAFVYDAKVISRLQGGGAGVNNNARSPQAVIASYGHIVNDQNYCPNTMTAAGQSVTTAGGAPGYDYTTHDPAASSVPAGLGGYWMTLENGEKVWCSVDSRQFSSLDRKQQSTGVGGSMKLSRTSTKLSGGGPKSSGQFGAVTPAVKSSSLGNFQEYIGKSSSLDDNDMMSVQPDAISVTSGSSEHKKREKVWRETSLDSPVVKHKALPPVPPSLSGQGQMSPSSIGSGQLMGSPHGGVVPQSPPYIPPMSSNPSTAPLHINTNVSGYGGPCSPLLLSPQQMRYYQQRQQQLLEQQRQRIKLQQVQQQQQFHTVSKQQESVSPRSPMGSIGGGIRNSYQSQPDPPIMPPYQSRHQHPPPPPLPPPNQHHYHHSQQLQNRLQHPPSTPAQPQHLDLLPSISAHHSPSLGHHRATSAQHQADSGYYPLAGHLSNTLSSRHPDLVISPTLSQASSHTLTSVVQALPVIGGLEENGLSGPSSPTPSAGKVQGTAAAPPSDIQMESPKNMTVVQQGKIMPYKEVTKPFEMSDFYKYSTKYRQKQQQQQQNQLQQLSPSEVGSPVGNDGDPAGGGDGIHKGIYQPPNRSICQPLVNHYN